MTNKLACPLGEGEVEVSKEIIAFLKQHSYIDVFEDDKYLWTLKRLKEQNQQEHSEE